MASSFVFRIPMILFPFDKLIYFGELSKALLRCDICRRAIQPSRVLGLAALANELAGRNVTDVAVG
jgi:hypothetical protein